MPDTIGTVIKSSIYIRTGGIPQKGFGTMAVVGPHNFFTERMRFYGDAPSLALDMPDASHPIRRAAEAAFSSTPQPSLVAVGRVQVDTVRIKIDTIADASGKVYAVRLNGVKRSYDATGGDDQDDVATGLAAVLTGISGFDCTATDDTAILTVTTGGTAFSCYADASSTGDFRVYMEQATDLGETGSTVADQWIAALDAIDTYNPNWYALSTTARTHMAQDAAFNALNIKIADWCEARQKIYLTVTKGIGTPGTNNDILDTSPLADTTSLPALVKAGSYQRTAVVYHEKAYGPSFFEITVGSTDDATGLSYAVDIHGETFDATGSSRETEVAVAANLASLIDASDDYVATSDGSKVTVTATTVGMPFAISTHYTTTGVLAVVERSDQWIEDRWLGQMMTYDLDVATATWCHKTLPGATPDSLTPTQFANASGNPISNLAGKNCNTYTLVGTTAGGRSVMRWGFMGSGEWIDIIHGADHLSTRLAESALLCLLNNAKIPFSDDGIETIKGTLRGPLNADIQSGFILKDTARWGKEGFLITAPAYADISVADKAARKLKGIQVKVTPAGAIHTVELVTTIMY